MPFMVPTSIGSNYLAEKAKYATRMEDRGSTPDNIFYTTGTVREGGDNYLDYINTDVVNMSKATMMSDRMGRNLDVQVGDLGLEDLNKAAPSIGIVPVYINPAFAGTNKAGKYYSDYDEIGLAQGPLGYGRTATLMHEMQHALDQRGANNPKLQAAMSAYLPNMEAYVKDKNERRAMAAETSSLMARFDEDGGRERLYQVVKRGLPSTVTAVEDAIINENVVKQMLRRRSK